MTNSRWTKGLTALAVAGVVALGGCAEDEPAAVGAGSTDASSSETSPADAAQDAAVAEDSGGGGTDGMAFPDGASVDTGGSDATAADSDPVDVPPVDASPAECTADEKKACNDGLDCTTDSCSIAWGKPLCAWQFKQGACLIGGLCRQKGEAKPGDACAQCLPEQATTTWSVAPEGAACDDGDLCTWNGNCSGKQCKSEALKCDDQNPCTADVCDPKKGCGYPFKDGQPCDDGSACSQKDLCAQGKCVGNAPLNCNDGNPCTDDACDIAKACTHTNNSAVCVDGDACTADDTCAQGKCVSGAAPNCDDGNACTLDICDKGAGCYHLALQSPCCLGQTSICDDQNPCTTDDCDPKTTKCGHSDNTAVCDDGSACTSTDTCKKGTCLGSAKTCDDKNPCTVDQCDPKKGCVFAPAGTAACDDGNPCTQSDVCSGGVCKGVGQCACTPTFAKQSQKLTYIQIGDGGKAGQGLDLDNNPKTCAPADTCSGGIDNSLGSVASIANKPLLQAVEDGSINFLFELKDFKQGPVNLALYTGKLDPKNSGCDPQKASCIWQVDPKMLDPQKCLALVQMPGQLAGTLLKAGGPNSNFPFTLPIQGLPLVVTIYGARIEATVQLQGDQVIALDGILAGAVPKASLMAAIDGLPDTGLPAGLDKATIKGLLEVLVESDIDTNGDGVKDSASIALKIKGTAASISGMY